MIHRLRDLYDLEQPGRRQMPTFVDNRERRNELVEVIALGRQKRMHHEERNDDVVQLVSALYAVLPEVFLVIVVTLVRAPERPTPKKLSSSSSDDLLRSPCVTANRCITW